MGVITRKFPNQIDSIVTESYVYVAVDLSKDEAVKRVKVQRSLWDTGASVSLISSRVAKVLGLGSITVSQNGTVDHLLISKISIVTPAILLGNGILAETIDEAHAQLVDNGHDRGLACLLNRITVV